MSSAKSGPLIRITPTPPLPDAVATAMMGNFLVIIAVHFLLGLVAFAALSVWFYSGNVGVHLSTIYTLQLVQFLVIEATLIHHDINYEVASFLTMFLLVASGYIALLAGDILEKQLDSKVSIC